MKFSVLVVGIDPLFQQLVIEACDDDHAEIEFCLYEKDAIQKIKNETPDILFFDARDPQNQGMNLLRSLPHAEQVLMDTVFLVDPQQILPAADYIGLGLTAVLKEPWLSLEIKLIVQNILHKKRLFLRPEAFHEGVDSLTESTDSVDMENSLGGEDSVVEDDSISDEFSGELSHFAITVDFYLFDRIDYFKKILPGSCQQSDGRILLKSLLSEDSIQLIDFAFGQKENLDFPLEFKWKDLQGHEQGYQVSFAYDGIRKILVGNPQPIGEIFIAMESRQAIDDLGSVSESESDMMIDDATRDEVLADSNSLASDVLTLVKELEPWAFPGDSFSLESYQKFVLNKNINDYSEKLRIFANKIHSLKGCCGFLIPDAKELCHHIENLLKPLTELHVVLTPQELGLFKQSVFQIQEELEHYPQISTKIDLPQWVQSIESMIEKSKKFIGTLQPAFVVFLEERSHDTGKVRKSRKEDYFSVSRSGYETLAQQVKTLFYYVSEQVSEEQQIHIGNLYNEFVDIHQRIKKIPIDLSRYERLIPSLGREYGKDIEWVSNTHHVLADNEFWNALHEILNHSLKNGVTHGIETPAERQSKGKTPQGKITVDITEDALHIFLKITDDGNGIDVERVAQKAIENGIRTSAQIAKMNRNEIINLIFEQGVSTAKIVDDNAGRGVGLNAVLETLHNLQGIIQTETVLGIGTTWIFQFPKSNVSLSCFLVSLGNDIFGIPEDYIDSFHEFDSSQMTTVNQHQGFRYENKAIPFLQTDVFFNGEVSADPEKLRRVLLLRHDQQQIGLIINDIIHHATLPIRPFPEEYHNTSAYLGLAIYGNMPVLVLSVAEVFRCSTVN